MSIGVCGRIQRQCVDIDILEKTIIEMLAPFNDFHKEQAVECVTYREVDKDDALSVYFVYDEKASYNVWHSELMRSEYQYSQAVMFDIPKERASIAMYQGVINFFICLRKKIESDILVTSDVHNDICLVKAQEILWSQDLSFDYKSICMRP